MPFNWYLTTPGDRDIVSQFPPNERSFRLTAHDAFAVEHDVDNGRHKIGIGDTTARDAITTWVNGSLWVNTTDARNRLQVRISSAWTTSQEFSAGTSIIFCQAAAPTGWVQTSDNDRVIRVVSGAGAGTGGAWTISGLSTENVGHTHNIVGSTSNESSTHTHNYGGGTADNIGGSQGTNPTGGPSTSLSPHHHDFSGTTTSESSYHYHTVSFASSGASASHTHTGDGSWRPAYLNVIRATKS